MTSTHSGSEPQREVLATSCDDWPENLLQEFHDRSHNGHVGGRLLLENDQVRVWEIRLAPGERHGAHRHVLNYFWVAVTEGVSIQHTSDGRTERVSYKSGDTMFFSYREGEYMLHDLANAGNSELVFTTVELKDSTNESIPLNEKG
jgi:hypothetical protein